MSVCLFVGLSKCIFEKGTDLRIFQRRIKPVKSVFVLISRHWFPGELLQLEELPGPLLVDNMQDEVGNFSNQSEFQSQNVSKPSYISVNVSRSPGNFLIFVFQASKSYGSFPDRLYVILDGVVVFQVDTCNV